MKIQAALARENGYSLMETMIAMSLFLSVLIPLGTLIGNLMIDSSYRNLNKALDLAQSEMNRTIASRDFSGRLETDTLGLMLKRKLSVQGHLAHVSISVSTAKKPDKIILELTKSVLVYP